MQMRSTASPVRMLWHEQQKQSRSSAVEQSSSMCQHESACYSSFVLGNSGLEFFNLSIFFEYYFIYLETMSTVVRQ